MKRHVTFISPINSWQIVKNTGKYILILFVNFFNSNVFASPLPTADAGTYSVAIDGVTQADCSTYNLPSGSEITYISNMDFTLPTPSGIHPSGIGFAIFGCDPVAAGYDLDDPATYNSSNTCFLDMDNDQDQNFDTQESNCGGLSDTDPSWPSMVWVVPVTLDLDCNTGGFGCGWNLDDDGDGCVAHGCPMGLIYDPLPTFSCGDVFTDAGGASGDYCTNAPPSGSASLSWLICPSTTGDVLTLDFTSWAVENYSAFGGDQMTIYDGNNSGASIIGMFSGSTGSPGMVMSSGGCLYIEFETDEFVNLAGWTADISCGSPPTLCDCTDPSCIAAGYTNLASVPPFPDVPSCETAFVPPLNGQPVETCHEVTVDASGFLGLFYTPGDNGNGCYSNRSATLYNNVGGMCGSSIPVTTANGGNASFNPEWSGLTPGNYIMCVTFDISPGCDVGGVCMEYYGQDVCDADAGTYDITGVNSPAFNQDQSGSYTVPCCGTLNIDYNGDGTNAPPDPLCGISELGYAIFNCDPIAAGYDLEDEDTYQFGVNPCYLGMQTSSGTIIDNNDDGQSENLNESELWVVPVTLDCAGCSGPSCGPDNVDGDDDDCVDFSGPFHIIYEGGCGTGGCGTCPVPCTETGMGNVATYPDRSWAGGATANPSSCWTPNCPIDAPYSITNCWDATADATGFLGFAQQIDVGSFLCLPSDWNISWELHEQGSCGSVIANPVPNANGVSSGFNPEYTGLTPNGSYVICVTYTSNWIDCGIVEICTEFYGSDCDLSTSANGMDANCGMSDGEVTITWTGGTAPFDITGDLSQTNASSPQTFMNLSSGMYTVTVTDNAGCTDTASVTIGDTAGPSASASGMDANCGMSDGEVTITWSGGTGPYDITGDLIQVGANSPQTFSNLASGMYTVTVTDNNGCTDSASVTIGDTAGPIAAASGMDANCGQSDGEVTVTWSGGTASYDIAGDLSQTGASSPQTFSNLASGTYTVTVTDDNGCSDTASVMIGDTPGIMASASADDATCGQNDGEVTISWSGGNTPFNITGDLNQTNATNPQTFSNLSSGTYTVTVTDTDGCTDTASATVGNTNGPTASANVMDASCGLNNGEITITWSGGITPYDITGDLTQLGASSPQTFTNLASGNYTVTVTDVNGCTSTASGTVGDSAGPNASASGTDANCGQSDGEVIITWSGGTSPFDITGDLSQIGASSPQTFSNLSSGTYTVTVTDDNGCSDTASVMIGDAAGPNASGSGMDATCGSTNGSVTISWGGGTAPYNITGDLGQTNASSPQTFLNLASGSYTVTVTDDNGCTDTASVTLGDTSGPTASATGMDANCGNSDGSVTISWSDGTGPFDITGDLNQTNASSPSQFTNLSSGTYTVTVTDNDGCSDTASFVVGDSNGPAASASGMDANCGQSDGEVTITWSGGAGPYDITGDLNQTNASSPQSFTNLSAGTYTVTVTDGNGCSDTASVLIGDSPGVMANGSATNTSCGQNDGEVMITWSGGTGPFDITGDLNQSNASSPQMFSNLSSGTYTVTVTDSNGCSDTATAIVGNTNGPSASASGMDATCGQNNGEVTITWSGGASPYNITGDLSQTGASSPQTFSNLSNGTYTVTVTDNNGCTSTASTTINDSGSPVANASAMDANCGQSDGEVTVTWSGGTAPYDITGDLSQTNAASPQTFSNLVSGTYTVTITDDNGCSDTASVLVDDSDAPMVSGSGTDANCGNANGTVNISWSGGASPYNITGDLSLVNASSPQAFNNLSSGIYTVTVTDDNGCSDTASVSIGDTNGPTANASGMDANCGNNDGSITITWSDGVGPFNISGDLNQTNASSPSQFTNLGSGSYTVTVTDNNGCTDTASVVLGDVAGPTANASAMDANCGNSDGEVTITWNGGTGPYNITGDLSQANATSPQTFNNLSTGSYTVTVTDTNGCTDTAMVMVGDSPTVTANGTSTNTSCGNSDGTVTISWGGGTSTFNISGDLNMSNASSPQVFSNLSSGTYTVTVADNNGCTDTASATVGNTDGPSASANAIDATCGNTNGEVSVSWNGGSGPYSITGDLNQTNAVSPQVFSNLSSGSYTVTVSDNNGCTSTASAIVNDLGSPNASVSGTDANCGQSNGEAVISWSGGSGPFDITGDLNQINATSPQIFNNLSSGTYNVTVTDNNGCTDTASIVLGDEPAPSLSGSGVDASCGNNSGSVTLSWNGGTGPYDITGDLGLVNAASPQIFSNLGSGTYNVTVTDNNGCTDTASIVIGDSSGPSAMVSVSDANCNLNDGELTITWSGGTGPFDISGDLNLSSATSPAQFSNLSSGSFNITVTDVNGCSDIVNTIINNLAGPSTSGSGTDASCGTSNGEALITWSGGTAPYEITGDLNQVNATSPQVFENLASGTYNVTVTDDNGCTDTASVIIGDSPTLSSNGNGTNTSCGNADGTMTISWSGGAGPFDIAGDLSQVNVSSPHVFNNLGSGTYTVTITDSNGCTDTASATIGNADGPTASANGVDESCDMANGEVSISWSGGTGPYDITGDLNLMNATSTEIFSGLSAGVYNVTVTDANGCESVASATLSNILGPVLTETSIDESCGLSNGSISLEWSEGVGPFDISGDLNQINAVSPMVFENLNQGTYQIEITDTNGCSDQVSVTINNVGGPNLTSVAQDENCSNTNGSIEFSWTDGSGPFGLSGDLALLNASSPVLFNGLGAGIYNVTLTDSNGCESPQSVEIQNIGGATFTSDSQNENCEMSDGSITLFVSGGVGPFDVSGDLNIQDASSPIQFNSLSQGTYNITLTDDNGCENVGSIEVGETQGATAIVMASATTCGLNNGIINLEWSGGVGPFEINGDFTMMNVVSPIMFSDLMEGDYNYNLLDANGCEVSLVETILPSTGMSANSNATNTSCGLSDGSLTISWSGGTGPFDITGDLQSTNVTSPFTFNNLGSGTYNLVIQDQSGCQVMVDGTVANDDGPTAFANSTDAHCGLADGTITINWNGGLEPYNITGDLSMANATSPQLFENISTGSYSIVVTDANSCSSTATVVIADLSGPILNGSFVPESCGMANGSITLNWTEGEGPYDITGDLSMTNVTSPMLFENLSMGQYVINLTDTYGCTDDITINVTETPGPMATTTSVEASCGNQDGSITIEWTGGDGPFELQGDVALSNVTSPLVLSNLGSGAYNFTLLDVNACIVSLNDNIDSSDGPILSSTQTEPSCGSQDGEITLTWNGGAGPYDITGDLSQTNVISPLVISNLGSGDFNFTITDSNNCPADVTITLTDSDAPEISFNVVNEICGNTNGEIEISWSGGTGPFNISGDVVEMNATSPTTFIGLAQGTFNVTITDSNNCSDSEVITMTNENDFVVTTAVVETQCGLDNGSITIDWSGGIGPFNLSGDSTLTNVSSPLIINDLPSGMNSFVLTDSNNCSEQLNLDVMSSVAASLLCSVLNGATGSGQSDGALTIEILSGSLPVNITWDGPDMNDGVENNWNQNQFDLNNIPGGTYMLSIVDANGCEAICSVVIPEEGCELDLQGVVSDVTCFDGSDGVIELIVSGANGAVDYSWDVAGVDGDNPGGLSSGMYTVTVVDDAACMIIETFIVENGLELNLDLSTSSSTLIQGDSILISATTNIDSEEISLVEWTPSQDVECSTCLETYVFPANSTDYLLTLTDINGCMVSAELFIEVESYDDIYVPNIFSPNNDSSNEIFRPFFSDLSNFSEMKMSIFDRWGNRIYESENMLDASEGWDGRFMNKELNPGVFVYLIEYKNGSDSVEYLQGDVTLVR